MSKSLWPYGMEPYPTLPPSRPGSSVHGISQARILEWVVISFSRGSSPIRDQTQVSYIANRFFTSEPEKSMSLAVKNPRVNAGDIRDVGSIPRFGRSPGGGNGNPLQYSTWRIPWTMEPGELWSIELQRVGQVWSNLAWACITRVLVAAAGSFVVMRAQ